MRPSIESVKKNIQEAINEPPSFWIDDEPTGTVKKSDLRFILSELERLERVSKKYVGEFKVFPDPQIKKFKNP